MRKIATSILSADFYKLGEEIETALKLGADWIHVDVMDGHFVPQLTYGSKIVEDIKKNNKNVFCDVHLMITNPEEQAMHFIEAGADLVNFQSEVCGVHGDRLINLIKDNKRLAGITINPTTPISFITHYLPIVDLVLVMSVNPGYGGQKCIEYTFDKAEELKKIREKNNYKYFIEIDGGISIKNVNKALSAGVDVVVTGNSFFKASIDDKKVFIEAIHKFEK
jgi:ribulose-phosphate 3-epimerase